VNGGRDQIAAGEEKEINKKEQKINHRQPRGDPAGNHERTIAQQKNGAQTQRREYEDQADHIHLAGRGKGGKAGDNQKEDRGLEETLDLRRRKTGCGQRRHPPSV